jgi:DNA-binding transcriptional MerR regulator
MRGRRVGLSIAQIRDILDAYEEKGEEAQNAIALGCFQERIAQLEAQRAEVDEAIHTLKAAAEYMAAQGVKPEGVR